MTEPTSTAWYREPTMMLVIGVLTFTVISGFTMLGVALNHDDALVISDEDYREWRDDMRATKPIDVDDD